MDKVQINKSRMYGTTDLVLDNHAELFAQMQELVAAHKKLKTGLDVIDQNRQVQEVDSTGLTKNKAELRANLIEITLQFAAALKAHATAVKDIALKTKANYTASDLKTSADPILYDIGALLLGLANTVKTELVKYAIDDAAFKAMEMQLAGFKMAVPRRRVAASESKASTLNIENVFKVQDKLLKDEIDSLMLPFRFTQTDFYNAYKNARRIVDYTGRGKATPPAGDNTPGYN